MEKATQIFVNFIPSGFGEREIKAQFEKFGDIKSVAVKNGFCFIVR